LEYSTIRK